MTSWNDLKLSKKYKFIIFKLSDDLKQIVVEEASDDKDWETFRGKLLNAKTVSKTVRCLLPVHGPHDPTTTLARVTLSY